ncbi:AAA family ATPase [Actinosynnema sp. NPDC059335]|uniref:AAA family ATPase n=1 Tax=Actinosynnema sp. NPDC059335 TaxID=3346804 RepID=UPI00366A7C31
MTAALVALIGPPGAGKTSERHLYPHAQVVSLDDNRRLLSWCGCSSNQDPILRAHAVELAFSTARSALAAGCTVLWDATNADPADRRALLVLAAEYHATTTAVLVLPRPSTVLRRNNRRDQRPCACGYARRVPDDVVLAMYDAINRDQWSLDTEGWSEVRIA